MILLYLSVTRSIVRRAKNTVYSVSVSQVEEEIIMP